MPDAACLWNFRSTHEGRSPLDVRASEAMRKGVRTSVVLGCLAVLALWCGRTSAQPTGQGRTSDVDTARAVAVTVDDLPTVRGRNLQRMQAITSGLLRHLDAYDIPATGFVNEQGLGEPDVQPERVALLEAWLEAGHDLGNHTYAHPQLLHHPASRLPGGRPSWRNGDGAAARRATPVLPLSLPQHGAGPGDENGVRAVLGGGGLRGRARHHRQRRVDLCLRLRQGGSGGRQRPRRPHRHGLRPVHGGDVRVFTKGSRGTCSGASRRRCSSSTRTCSTPTTWTKLAAMMQARGYRFISLEEALQDPAYRLPDEYTGESGLSWLQRWWITQGKRAPQGALPAEVGARRGVPGSGVGYCGVEGERPRLTSRTHHTEIGKP